MTKARKAFNVDAWASATQVRKGGSKCAICSAPDDVRGALERIVRLRSMGKCVASQAQVVELLRDQFNFDTNTTSFHRHVVQHMRAKW